MCCINPLLEKKLKNVADTLLFISISSFIVSLHVQSYLPVIIYSLPVHGLLQLYLVTFLEYLLSIMRTAMFFFETEPNMFVQLEPPEV